VIYRDYSFSSSFKSGLSSIAPVAAGIMAPLGGWFFDLKSSQICSIVTHSTPSLVLMYSMTLDLSKHKETNRRDQMEHSPFQQEQALRVPAHVGVDGNAMSSVN